MSTAHYPGVADYWCRDLPVTQCAEELGLGIDTVSNKYHELETEMTAYMTAVKALAVSTSRKVLAS